MLLQLVVFIFGSLIGYAIIKGLSES